MKVKKSKFAWVFWLSISVRKQWFSYWWRTRGANFSEYQIWIFRITVGRPWIQDYIHSIRKNYSSLDHIRDTNRENLKRPFTFLIGKNSNP